jgi:hypothetical protein
MNEPLLFWRDIACAAGRLALDVDDDLRSDVVDVQGPDLLTDGDQVGVRHNSWKMSGKAFISYFRGLKLNDNELGYKVHFYNELTATMNKSTLFSTR